jgi:hypothetical protein
VKPMLIALAIILALFGLAYVLERMLNEES